MTLAEESPCIRDQQDPNCSISGGIKPQNSLALAVREIAPATGRDPLLPTMSASQTSESNRRVDHFRTSTLPPRQSAGPQFKSSMTTRFLFIVSAHGINLLREFEHTDNPLPHGSRNDTGGSPNTLWRTGDDVWIVLLMGPDQRVCA